VQKKGNINELFVQTSRLLDLLGKRLDKKKDRGKLNKFFKKNNNKEKTNSRGIDIDS